jgi:hypothetical protein
MIMANKWIKWAGGKCPVRKGALVDVKHRDGDIFLRQRAGVYAHIPDGHAEDWSHDDIGSDITAYRLSTKKAK